LNGSGQGPSPEVRVPPSSGTDEAATLVKRLLQRAQGIRSAGSRSERSRKVLLGVAFAAFVAMGVVALRNYPDDVAQTPNWWALVAVGIVGPTLTILLNAAEYRVQGRMVDVGVGLPEALQVTILGTAANMLPLPGSMLVRTQALSGRAGYRAAIRTTTVAGATWLFCTAVLAGIALMFLDLVLVGSLVAAVGLVGVAGSGWLTRRTVENWRRPFAALVAVETATALVGAGRLLGILLALGLDVTVGQAMALTLSGVIAAATGIFPSGLGIREAVAAGIASAVSLPASVGFVATAADRIAGLVVLAVASLVVFVTRPPTGSPEQSR
jgi:hypothetical protein